jgi:telomerase protein component 1
MAHGWRTVRVFISSTFLDMQAERDHLVRFVFPRLRETLARRRIHLVDIDLRWGVTAEQSALDLCLDEIDRCRPRFICMLGGRYGWVPPDRTESITASEVVYGALDPSKSTDFRFFYFRDAAATAAIPDADAGDYREAPDSDAAAALEQLKQRVRAAGVSVVEYACAWDAASRRVVGLERFGAAVHDDLLASVDEEFGPADDQPSDEFADERAAMEAFVETRVERYVVGSRGPLFERLRAHTEGRGDGGWLLLVGEPGTGKSALMGRFWRDVIEASGSPGPRGPLVLAHFAGATAASVSARQVLRRFCHELGAANGVDEALPDETDKLRDLLVTRLKAAGERGLVLLIVDAVNQIEGGGTGATNWLPHPLPPGVRGIASLLSGTALDALRERRPPLVEVALEPVSAADATAIIDGFLDRYRKALDASQREALLAKRDAGRPLYLVTALEELRTLGTYDEISARIREMPGDVEALFDWVLARLEGDQGFRDGDHRAIGADLVRSYCSLLAAGRVGMTETELAELAAPGGDGQPADVLGNVAALQRLLRPYLMRRGPLVDFFHGQLRAAVEARYLRDAAAWKAIHGEAADYFSRKADPAGDRTWTSGHERALSELPFHLTEAGRWDRLQETLTDLGFLEAKCTHVAAVRTGSGADARTIYYGVYELQEDYRRALERMPAAT